MNKHASPLAHGPIIPALLKLSIPILISNILQTAYQITDTFWVGRLSAQAVAAVSLSFPVNFLLIALGGGLPIAGTVLIAQYKGKGDTNAMNHVAAQTLMMVVGVSIVLSVVGFVFSEPIMRIMGAGPDILADAVSFLRYTFAGFIFVFGFFVFQSLMRGMGVVQMPMYIVALTVLLNFFLDPLFIFGYGPVPALGVSGAAMATLCTQAVATVIGFTLLFTGRYGIHLKLRDLKPDPAFIRRAFRLGLPASIEQSTRALGMTVMTILVASFGTMMVAAYGIGIRVLSLVFIPGMGLSIATSVLVGQSIGAGNIRRAERAALIGGAIAFTVLQIAGIILYFLAVPLATFFVPEGGEAIGLSATFVRITAFTFGLIGVQMVISGTLQGAGSTTASMILTLVSQWVFQFPLAYILSMRQGWGEEGIWWSFTLSNILSVIVAAVWFARGDWKKKRLIEDTALEKQVKDEARIDEGITA